MEEEKIIELKRIIKQMKTQILEEEELADELLDKLFNFDDRMY